MAYGHAERCLAAIRQLEAETRQLLAGVGQLDQEQAAWLEEADRQGGRAFTGSRSWSSGGTGGRVVCRSAARQLNVDLMLRVLQ